MSVQNWQAWMALLPCDRWFTPSAAPVSLGEATPPPKPFRAPVEPQVVRPPDEAAPARAEDNSEAARVLGKRAEDVHPDGVLVINFPGEEGYHCPVCTYAAVTDGEFDERLAWSEYRTMLWCYVCERDYPSALCLPGDIDNAIAVYLSSVEQISARGGSPVAETPAEPATFPCAPYCEEPCSPRCAGMDGESVDAMRSFAARPLRGDGTATGYVINRYGSPIPPPDVDLTACPLSTCTNYRKPPCDSCGAPWGHCADDCQDPTECHDEAKLRAEIYRLRAVFRWLDGHDQFGTARKAKALGRQYGIASRTIADLRGRLARAQIAAAPAHPGAARPADGVALIAAERARQTAVEGWTPEYDDEHAAEQLASAAACYALPPDSRKYVGLASAPWYWPWAASWWKPCPDDRVRELVKAGALIAAEIDRLSRGRALLAGGDPT